MDSSESSKKSKKSNDEDEDNFTVTSYLGDSVKDNLAMNNKDGTYSVKITGLGSITEYPTLEPLTPGPSGLHFQPYQRHRPRLLRDGKLHIKSMKRHFWSYPGPKGRPYPHFTNSNPPTHYESHGGHGFHGIRPFSKPITLTALSVDTPRDDVPSLDGPETFPEGGFQFDAY